MKAFVYMWQDLGVNWNTGGYKLTIETKHKMSEARKRYWDERKSV